MTRRVVTAFNMQPLAPEGQPTTTTGIVACRPGHSELMLATRFLGIAPSQLRNPSNVEDDGEGPGMPATENTFYTLVTSDLLIPGYGQPITGGALVIEAKTIVWVGARDAIPTRYSNALHVSHHVPYMMPGLWDVHMHFTAPSEDPETLPRLMTYGPFGDHPASQGARLAKQCWEALQRGYTSMRDCGGYGCELTAAISDGAIVGPNVYSAGAYISQTAGHGDQFHMPPGDALLRFGVNNVQPGFFSCEAGVLADGADECRRAVRLQVRRGAKCIKIMATGGVMSLEDNPKDAQFCEEEMFAIVDEATRMGRSVAAHCHAKAGIVASVLAGVKTIEHGSYADEECMDLMKKHNVIYVPTRRALTMRLELGDMLPKKVLDKLKMINEVQLTAYKLAVAKDVTIALGTDTAPGMIDAVEIQHAVEAGMTNLEALQAATATAPLVLGRQAPKSGQLKAGYDADILGLTVNPADDVTVLQKKENIKWVWKGGKLFKGPNIGPWGEE